MTTNFTDDLQLGELLRAEVPAPAEGYWADIHDTLAAATPADPEGERAQPIDVITNDPTVVPFRIRLRRGLGGAAAIAVAAGLLLIVGLLVGTRLQRSSDRVDAGFAGQELDDYGVRIGEGNGPRQNLDHWHSVYGVWDCTTNNGAGGWLDKFDSSQDDVGIHSHDNGVIDVHPFFEESAEENATFSHFADSMNFELSDRAVTLDNGYTLLEGTSCNGEPATLHIRRWQNDSIARSQTVLVPQVITENLGAERFYNDREVWVLALAPLDAEIPLPPEQRFVHLDNESPPPTGALLARPVPAMSVSTMAALDAGAVRFMKAAGPVVNYIGQDAPPAPFERLTREPRPPWTDPIVDDTFRVIATATAVDERALTLATYRIELGDEQTRPCLAIIDLEVQQIAASSYCETPTSPARLIIEEQDTYLFLRNTPTDATYVVIETTDGVRLVTNTVERHAYVGWSFRQDPIANVEFYNSSRQLISTCPTANRGLIPECLLTTAD